VLYRVGDGTYPFIAIIEGEVAIFGEAGNPPSDSGETGSPPFAIHQ
jgi:hypothetical protein